MALRVRREKFQGEQDLHDARQGGHVGELLDGGQETAVAAAGAEGAQLVEQQGLQLRIYIEPARHAHVGHKAGVHLALHRADAPDEAHLLQEEGASGVGMMHLRSSASCRTSGKSMNHLAANTDSRWYKYS